MLRREGDNGVKRRIGYLLAFFVVLVIELYIGLFVRDQFIRPYVGDMLVTVLLCCLCRTLFPRISPALPVFLFAALVEGVQALDLVEKLGLEGTVFAIVVGATFDWKDILCYGVGCVAFAVAEHLIKRRKGQR